MAVLKALALLSLMVIMASAVPGDPKKETTGENDQLVSGSSVSVVPDSQAVAASTVKGDLKTSDSFGFGYYLPVVAPALVKYHYPLFYYPTYLHSARFHGYGGYGFYQHGHGVIHH